MSWLIKRGDAVPYANGTRLKEKSTGRFYRIEKECFCGDWLHYDVSEENVTMKYHMVFQHQDIERLFEIVT